MIGGPQYITVGSQQAVTIPVVGGMQGHMPPIGHVVQVRFIFFMYVTKCIKLHLHPFDDITLYVNAYMSLQFPLGVL